MDSAAVLKCNDYEFQCLLGGYLHNRTKVVYKCTLEGEAWYLNIWRSVQWRGVYSVIECTLVEQLFYNLSLKLTNQK